jgi:glycosyltransferase involved in cell wall biosynthesis
VTRKGLFFLSPIMPDEQGNGLAMRAGVTLGALSRSFDVHLGLVPVAGGSDSPSPLTRRLAASIRSLPLAEYLDPYYALIERIVDPEARRRARLAYPKPYLSRFCTGQSGSVIADWCTGNDISVIHVMRLYLAPLVRKLAADFRVLDLDEDDVTTHRQIADLHRRAGVGAFAERDDAEAAKYETLLGQSLAGFHRVLVSSPIDAERVRRRAPEAAISIAPNAAPVTGWLGRMGVRPDQPLRLIFVGNLGYAPNEDAVCFLCREILPRLRAALSRPVAACVAGPGASASLGAIAVAADVELLGAVGDLRPLYAEADIAVVPVRGGGGTRIKILEAFAYGIPVVATPVGIEGIAARDGEHALIADGPDAFAHACLSLAGDPARARDIAARALQLVDAFYHVDVVEAGLLAIYQAYR